MTAMDDDLLRPRSPFPVSFWTALGGVLLAVTVGIPLCLWIDNAFGLVMSCALCVAVSALTTGLIEWRDRPAKIGVLFGLAGIIASLLLFSRISETPAESAFTYQTATALGIIAGLMAVGRKDEWLKGAAPLAILWIAALVFAASHVLTFNSAYVSGGQAINASWALVTGPWTTQVLRIVHFPNAGAFFNPPLAFCLTGLVASATAVTLLVHERRVAALALILFAPLILVWTLIGWHQVLACVG
ncbi:MAG TPA: hypothetical protein PLO37_01955 [Candidatus Hydrogenedentes bacterium]|mgnify:CR=1 FL=1|nr:hypothetical protein [Candidatus Hydrogenedentota bacterium]HPG65581.1 hypothetical protein [Candidatus Hydrogenedentota bacterium]